MVPVALPEVTERSFKQYIPPRTSLLRLLLAAHLVVLVREVPLVQPVQLLSLSPLQGLSRPSRW